MPPKLVRITIDVLDPFVKVLEYGSIGELTIPEQEELAELSDVLVEYSDFTTANDLEDEKRQDLMRQKQRYELLKNIEKGGQIIWTIQDNSLLNSLLVIMSRELLPIYVENIPHEFINRILDPMLTVNITGSAPDDTIPTHSDLDIEPAPTEQPPTNPFSAQEEQNQVTLVQTVLSQIATRPTMSANQGMDWLATNSSNDGQGLVYVSTESPQPGQTRLAGVVYAWPVKYLKDDWAPVNEALKKIFGDKLNWVRTDPGKWSHWTVKF